MQCQYCGNRTTTDLVLHVTLGEPPIISCAHICAFDRTDVEEALRAIFPD